MSVVGGEGTNLGQGLLKWVADLVRQARRTAPGPALVRLASASAAAISLAVAVPVVALRTGWLAVLLMSAAGVALFPRTRWVSVVILAAAGAWTLTSLAGATPVTLWRVAVLAGSLYLTHAGAALAAVLPYDCDVSRSMLLRWAGRFPGVLAVSLGIALIELTVLGGLPAQSTVLGPIVGAALAAAVASVLAWQLLRRR
ncbi:MAG TPA: hypothetical protein VF163_01265 [Micromonosporaceae bacterium]